MSLQGKVQEVNASLSDLYYLAYADTLNNEPYSRVQTTKRFPDTVAKPFLKRTYGKYWHKPILEVSDTLPFVSEWGKSGNRWNYSIEVPKERATAAFLQKAMQRDLKTFFGYHVTVEIRNMPCYFLRALSTAEQKLRTATPDGTPYRFELLANWKKDETVEYKNFEIRDLIKYLHNNLFDILHIPFIDETGIIGEIDFTNRKSIYEEVAKGNMEVVQAYLKSFHLYLEKGEKPMKVVVIRDPEELR